MRAAWPWLGSCAAAAVLFSASEVAADEPWLKVSGSPRCPSDAAAIAARVEQEIAGERDPALQVEIELQDAGRDTAVQIRLLHGRESTSKRLRAPACDEALEAAASVVALALSSTLDAIGESATAQASKESALAGREVSEPEVARGVAEPALDRSITPAPAPRSTQAWQVHGAAGLDVGTLDEPTAIVGAGASATFGAAELRATGWYGLPSMREEASSSSSSSSAFEHRRAEFAALGAEYCRGIDGERWLRACAGLEGRVAWLARQTLDPEGERQERTRVLPALGASAGAAFSYRSLGFRPELVISAQMPLAGALERAATPIIRALLGGELSL
jgi:hypothetical protein